MEKGGLFVKHLKNVDKIIQSVMLLIEDDILLSLGENRGPVIRILMEALSSQLDEAKKIIGDW